MIFSKT